MDSSIAATAAASSPPTLSCYSGGGNEVTHTTGSPPLAVTTVSMAGPLQTSAATLSAKGSSSPGAMAPPLHFEKKEPSSSPAHGSSGGDVSSTQDATAVMEEMDMFDIELQREFQEAATNSNNNNVHSHASPVSTTTVGGHHYYHPNSSGLVVVYASSTLRQPPSSTRGGQATTGGLTSGGSNFLSNSNRPSGPPTNANSSSRPPGSTKLLSSVAGACRVSGLSRDRDESMRLVHILAHDIKKELHLSHAGPANFEDDLRLVSLVVQEIQQHHLSPAGGWGSPLSPNAGPHCHGPQQAAGAQASSTGPQSGSRHALSRTSPASRSTAHHPLVNNNNGRSTIDTEVRDSLCRISHSHQLAMPEYGIRPINPYQGGPHSTYTTPRQAPQTQHPANSNSQTNPLSGAASAARTAGMHRESVSAAGVPRKASRSISGVARPRAVKPQPSSSKGYSSPTTVAPSAQHVEYTVPPQRSRGGPRSQTGKNVAPSNHSAFSECSWGETRSYRSTIASQNPIHITDTTNTSLSSTVLHVNSVHCTSVVNGSSTGGAVGTPAPIAVGGVGTMEGGGAASNGAPAMALAELQEGMPRCASVS